MRGSPGANSRICAPNPCSCPCRRDPHLHKKAEQPTHQSGDPQVDRGSRRDGNLHKERGAQQTAGALQRRSSNGEGLPCPRMGLPVPRLLHCCPRSTPHAKASAFLRHYPFLAPALVPPSLPPTQPRPLHRTPAQQPPVAPARPPHPAVPRGAFAPAPERGAGTPPAPLPREGRGFNLPAAREGLTLPRREVCRDSPQSSANSGCQFHHRQEGEAPAPALNRRAPAPAALPAPLAPRCLRLRASPRPR